MRKTKLPKIWVIFLGIATEVAATVFIIAIGLGLSWLISGGWR